MCGQWAPFYIRGWQKTKRTSKRMCFRWRELAGSVKNYPEKIAIGKSHLSKYVLLWNWFCTICLKLIFCVSTVYVSLVPIWWNATHFFFYRWSNFFLCLFHRVAWQFDANKVVPLIFTAIIRYCDWLERVAKFRFNIHSVFSGFDLE